MLFFFSSVLFQVRKTFWIRILVFFDSWKSFYSHFKSKPSIEHQKILSPIWLTWTWKVKTRPYLVFLLKYFPLSVVRWCFFSRNYSPGCSEYFRYPSWCIMTHRKNFRVIWNRRLHLELLKKMTFWLYLYTFDSIFKTFRRSLRLQMTLKLFLWVIMHQDGYLKCLTHPVE